MTKNNTMMLVLGLAAVGGAIWYFSKNKNASLPSAAPTYKSTLDSSLSEMIADLQGWVARNDNGWNGQQSKIVTAILSEGNEAIKNMHALLWDIWKTGTPENYPFLVNSSLQPVAWNNSVGAWWDAFKLRNKI